LWGGGRARERYGAAGNKGEIVGAQECGGGGEAGGREGDMVGLEVSTEGRVDCGMWGGPGAGMSAR